MIRTLGTAVLVEGVADLRLLKWALHAGVRENRRNGKATVTGVATAADAIELALRQSLSGQEDVPTTTIEQDSIMWIGTLQAAEILGCTQRHVRRIAASLDGRRAGKAWVFPSETVQHYRDQEDNHDHRTRAA